MLHSEQINELAGALAKTQAEIEGASKTVKNTFFGSNYADLAEVWDAGRVMTKYGLSAVQSADHFESGIIVETLLMHTSGQWVRSITPPLRPKDWTPQAVGSCLTYGRRYGLAAALGIAQVDDDGNEASGRGGMTSGGAPKHSPMGDPEDVPSDMAIVVADRIRELLSSGDTAAAAEYQQEIGPQQDLYKAAWRLLNSTERSAWKALVKK